MCSGFEPDGAVRLKGQINPQACEHFPRDHCILGHTFNHYPPISDAFDNRIFFLYYTNDSTLTLLRNSLFNINKQHIFFHCYKKHLKWGDDAEKKVSPIIQCSMTSPTSVESFDICANITTRQNILQYKKYCFERAQKSLYFRSKRPICSASATPKLVFLMKNYLVIISFEECRKFAKQLELL